MKSINILGVKVNNITMNEAVDCAFNYLSEDGKNVIAKTIR